MERHEDARAGLGFDLRKSLLAVSAEHVAPGDVFNQPIRVRRIPKPTSAVCALEPLADEFRDDVAATE